MPLPEYFVWTRFGTEAGQTFRDILRRKEEERRVNKGMFFWGVGNSIGPSVSLLLNKSSRPEVLFSPIKSAAHVRDVSPQNVATWTTARGWDGKAYLLPERSMITSRFAGEKRKHYALVCHSDLSLTDSCDFNTPERIAFGRLQNIMTGNPLGASQVTAVVRLNQVSSSTEYPVAFRAALVPPYFLVLSDPKSI